MAEGNRQAVSAAGFSIVEPGARREPTASDAGPALRQVSGNGQEHLPLDRARLLVDKEGNASRQRARLPGVRIQRAQTDAVAGKTDQEEPRVAEVGRQEATPAA